MDVAINLQGGLGNVLFQVAFGLSVARRYGCRLSIGTLDLHHMTTTTYEYFLGSLWRTTPEALVADGFTPWTPGDVSLEKPLSEVLAATEARLDAAANGADGGRLWIVNGFFQSPMWWRWGAGAGGGGGDDGGGGIRARFAPPPEVREALLARLGGEEGAARAYFVHVRRGDYVGSPFDMALERAYFARALAAAPWRGREEGAVCVFFTDDPWYTPEVFAARTGVALGGRVIVAPRDLDECWTMWLMSLCRLGGVCSNSTFSWWGGFLNDAPDKWVAFPREWHSDRLAFPGMVAISANT